MADQKVVKTIHELVEESTIVYSNSDIDTLITINSSGYEWWYKDEDENYILMDRLLSHNDLSRMNILHARKTAKDWFMWELGEFTDTDPVAVSDQVSEVNKNTFNRNPDLEKVVPKFVGQDKKDAHTEHCCAEHKHCYYGNAKCTVVTGRKKPSYPCRCVWVQKP